jgi:hypothetical protein
MYPPVYNRAQGRPLAETAVLVFSRYHFISEGCQFSNER